MKRRGWLVLALVVSLVLTAVVGVAAEGGGYAAAWVEGQTQNVTNPNYALGAPDGLVAAIPGQLGQIMLDMGAEVSGGLVIYSTSSAPDMSRNVQLCTALDSCTYYNSFRPDPAGTLLEPDIPFRYVFIWDGNSTSPGFGLDAVYVGPVLPVPDSDGDGFNDDLDNCPVIANPDQADSDSDGVGDVCDICPLDPSNDADGDGVCGDVDNCPFIANDQTANGDGDELGDACDLPGMHVSDITLTVKKAGSRYMLSGAVSILNSQGQPVPKAVVTAFWTLPNGNTVTLKASTNRRGVATLKVTDGTGTYTLDVTGVTKSGLDYWSGTNEEWSDTITIL